MCIKWTFFFRMSFHLIFDLFLAESQKFSKGGKDGNNDEETEYFENKRFLSKRHLDQNEKAQNIPVVASRLVRNNSRI